MIKVLTPSMVELAKADLIAVLHLACSLTDEVTAQELLDYCIEDGSYRVVTGREWIAVVEAREDALEVCAIAGKLSDDDMAELHVWLCQVARNSGIPRLVLYGRKGWIRRLKGLDWLPTAGINNELACEVTHG